MQVKLLRMREEIESFILLCLLFAELRTPFCLCTQNFKQSWTTFNFTCYVSLDQGSTVYPPPPTSKKKQQQQQIADPQKYPCSIH